MKTLIIAPNWIGDALMAQVLLTLLKRAQPDQHIAALAPSWVAPVLEAMPEVDKVLATKLAHGTLQARDRMQFAKNLRSEKYDRCFVLPNSFKSALIPWLARIPQRNGYLGEARYGVLNRRLPNPEKSVPMLRRYAALASLVDIAVPDQLPKPRLHIEASVIDSTRKKFELVIEHPVIALCPGAEFGPAKRWPAKHFAALASQILEQHSNAQIILLGGPGDQMIAEEIRLASNSKRVRNLAGHTNLAEALALIAASSHVVSNDSGLMHVAAALQRPQIALFGSSDPRHTPPLSDKASILWLHLDCSPCFQRTCPLGHLNCLNQIEPKQVMDELQIKH